MSYTEAELSIVCPKCKAAPGGKCLDKVVDRSHWIENPHIERVEAAAQAKLDDEQRRRDNAFELTLNGVERHTVIVPTADAEEERTR